MILDGHFGTKILSMAITGLPHIASAVPYGSHKGGVRFLYRAAETARYSHDPRRVSLWFFACQM